MPTMTKETATKRLNKQPKKEKLPAGSLATRAMIVTVKISKWSATTTDVKATEHVEKTYKIAKGKSRVVKKLFDHELIKDIDRAERQMRQFHDNITLPWNKDGGRIISSDSIDIYIDGMRDHKHKFDTAVEKFLKAYPRLIREQHPSLGLGELFEETDYPSPKDIKERYEACITFDPLSDSGDFKCQLSETARRVIANDVEARQKLLWQEAINKFWDRFSTTVSDFSDKLKNYKVKNDVVEGVFRDSLVPNLKKQLDAIEALNIMNDPEISKLIKDAKTQLCQYDSERLREDKVVRKNVMAQAAEINNRLSAFI